MRIHPYPVSPFQANCYLIEADGNHCVVVDPGITAAPVVERALEQLRLEPVAIVLTHGHLDHAGDAHLLGARFGIDTLCHVADHQMVTQPAAGLGPAFAEALRQWGIGDLPEPPGLRGYEPVEEFAGLRITVDHKPGHTGGSVLLHVGAGDDGAVLTGDVLFAGSIGRTDLPGGSMTAMLQSLQEIMEEVPAHLPLLPGHGPGTTLVAELQTNPYLSRS